MSPLLLPVVLAALAPGAAPNRVAPPARARSTAEHALATYGEAAVRTLAELVAFPTVAKQGHPDQREPSFKAMTAYLERKAAELGLDFEDAGAVVVVGMGSGEKRLGLITHGDVQPADPSKWANGPFTLDAESKAGRLIGRGAEDDKGPIAAALYAMKAVKDRDIPLARRVELIVSYTEESDWEPFKDYLAKNPPPDLNVALDAEYPVVVAEKGWVGFHLRTGGEDAAAGPALVRLSGGAFLSQVPEDALAEIRGADEALTARLEAAAAADRDIRYTFERGAAALTIRARGTSAHSSKPWLGLNAITHLAEVLSTADWPKTPAGNAVRLVHDLVGTGHEAERFGRIAYADAFMGPLTLSLGTALPRPARPERRQLRTRDARKALHGARGERVHRARGPAAEPPALRRDDRTPRGSVKATLPEADQDRLALRSRRTSSAARGPRPSASSTPRSSLIA